MTTEQVVALMKAWFPLLMLIPAAAYLFYALGLKLTGKPWTAGAWLCYVGANLCFLIANIRGE